MSEAFLGPFRNGTAPSIALFTDTHYWPQSPTRDRFAEQMAALPERDGLLVHRTPSILERLFHDLAGFASHGGTAAVHLGDVSCGGGGFNQPADEYVSALRSFRALETSLLPSWRAYDQDGDEMPPRQPLAAGPGANF